MMDHEPKNLIRSRVRQWDVVAPALQGIRDSDIRCANTPRAMKFFTGAVLAALPNRPPLPWSGLVEQQRVFRKIKKI
jgi:hypothetical protein